MSKLVYVRVTGLNGLYINSVLLGRGECTWVDLDELGMSEEQLKASKIIQRADPNDPPVPVDEPAPSAIEDGADSNLGPDLAPEAETLEPEQPVRRPVDGSDTDDAEAIAQLVRNNTEVKLRNLATDEGVADVKADDDKAEIARKIVAKRKASA